MFQKPTHGFIAKLKFALIAHNHGKRWKKERCEGHESWEQRRPIFVVMCVSYIHDSDIDSEDTQGAKIEKSGNEGHWLSDYKEKVAFPESIPRRGSIFVMAVVCSAESEVHQIFK